MVCSWVFDVCIECIEDATLFQDLLHALIFEQLTPQSATVVHHNIPPLVVPRVVIEVIWKYWFGDLCIFSDLLYGNRGHLTLQMMLGAHTSTVINVITAVRKQTAFQDTFDRRRAYQETTVSGMFVGI